MRALRTSPPGIPPQTSVPREPAAHVSVEGQPSLPPGDDAGIGLLRRILSVAERCAERATGLEHRLRRIEKLQSRTAAGQRLGVNLVEAAELLGLDQKLLRPLLNDASKTKVDPTKLNFIPKGCGGKAVKWIHRSELDRFGKQRWQSSLAGSSSPAPEKSASKSGLSASGVEDSAHADGRSPSECSDRGAE